MRRVLLGLVVVFSLLGVYSVVSFGRQLALHYSNFRKIEIWVAQKQQQEEIARQRAIQGAAQQATPVAPTPAPPATAEAAPKK